MLELHEKIELNESFWGAEQMESEPCIPKFKFPYCHLLGVWYLGNFCNLSVTYRQKD